MKFVLAILFILIQLSSFSLEKLTIDTITDNINLKDYCYNFEDTTHTLTITDLKNVKWNKLDGPTTFNSNQHIQWLAYHLENTSDKVIKTILFMPYHLINKIDVYVKVNDSIQLVAQTGIHRPYSEKDIESMGYPIYLDLPENSTTTVYVRLDYLYHSLRATTYLMSKENMNKVIKESEITIWLWKGAFLFSLFVSALFYILLRLKLFLYYFLLNIGVAIFIGTQIGDYFMFFDTDKTNISNAIDFTGAILINLFLPQFLNALTPIKSNNLRIWKIMYFFIYIGIGVVLLNFIPSLRHSNFLHYSHFYIMFLSGIVFIFQLMFILKNVILKLKNTILIFSIYSIYVMAAFSEAILPNLGIKIDFPFVCKTLIYSSLFEMFSFMILMGKETITIYLERSNLLYKEKQHQKEIISSMVYGQEKERDRVGRELHDLIGANMAIIKQKINQNNVDLSKIVEQTITEVRNLSHGLVSNSKTNEDFEDEIKEMCHLFSNSKMECHSYFYNWPTTNNIELITHLYRITQELLQNASKHSQAKNVHLQFIGNFNNQISLIYEDDGIGFQHEKNNKGLGLNNIKNRVKLIHGTLQIDSKPNNKGTTVIIEINTFTK